MKIFNTTLLLVALLSGFVLSGCTIVQMEEKSTVKPQVYTTQGDNSYKSDDDGSDTDAEGSEITSADINLHSTDGKNYQFTYNNETFTAVYRTDLWTVKNSYLIRDRDDILIICQVLIDAHPVHGRDMVSYRTAEDMAYEWQEHNLAYDILPDNSALKERAKDVDLDPPDQGKSIDEILMDRLNTKGVGYFG